MVLAPEHPLVDVVTGAGQPAAVDAYRAATARKSDLHNQNGIVVNSTTPDGSFSIDGLRPPEAIEKITAWLEATGKGRKAVNCTRPPRRRRGAA